MGTAIYLAWHPVSSKSILVNLVLGSPGIAGFLAAGVIACAACYATKWMRAEFRSSMNCVAHLARWVVANAPDVVKAPPGQWSREQVSAITRQIVIDILCCEERYREDAHFVKDLGLD